MFQDSSIYSQCTCQVFLISLTMCLPGITPSAPSDYLQGDTTFQIKEAALCQAIQSPAMRQTNEMCEHLFRLGKFPKEEVWMSMLNIPRPVKRGIRNVTKFDMMFILCEFEAIGNALINHLVEFQKKTENLLDHKNT
jgi:hypothetical protein